MSRSQTYWQFNQDVQGIDEACTSRYYISPRPGNQYQSTEVTETTQICVRSVTITENIVGENQAIKQQKLEGGRVKQIVKARHLNLPHKLRPELIGCENNLGSSSSKEDRKVYVRQTTASSPSVADMVKRFESRTGQVYIQQTTPLSSSASYPTFVAEMVKQFESRTSEILPNVEHEQCTATKFPRLDSISGNWEEVQNEDDLLPVIKKVGTADLDKFDSQLTKEKGNMYKKYIEESQSAKKMKEERVVKNRISQTMAPKENENIYYKRYSEAESAKKMKVERVVQKRIAQAMAHNEKENIYERNTECASAMKMKEERLVKKQILNMIAPKDKENICRKHTEESQSAKKMKDWKVVQKRKMKTMVLNAKENVMPNLRGKQRSARNCSPASKVR